MVDPSALISIVIRTHDRPVEMVAEAARSALGQDGGGEFELVIAHSGPEERLDGMIDGLPDAPGCSRICKVDAQRAAGNRAAMCNAGVKGARGEWVRFVDDDPLAPGALAAYRGRWAMQHAGHPAVVAAAPMGRREWGQSGAEHLGGVSLPGGGGTGWD